MIETVKARKGQLLSQPRSDPESGQTVENEECSKEEMSATGELEPTYGGEEFAEFRREAEQVTYTAKVTATKVLATLDVV